MAAQSAVLQDPKLREKLQLATNAAPQDQQTSMAGEPDPVASNANLETEDRDLAAALKSIVKKLAANILVARREQIYRAGRAELYNLGKQYIFWNAAQGAWNGVTPNGVEANAYDYEVEAIDRTYNFYKGFNESFMTTASQQVPPVPFHPEDPSRREDIEGSKAATDASEYVARVNDAPMLMERLAYHGFTGGLMATYVRSVTDGNRFGYEVDPESGQPTNVPKSQVVISNHGALDISLPPLSDTQDECDYLAWHTDLPKSKAKATYPWAADKIGSAGTMTDDDLLARLFRTAVRSNVNTSMPSDALDETSTLLRIWLRPSTYWCLDTDKVKKLQAKFPKGVVVHYVGGTYVASMPENLDDHWTIEQACEGRGMCRGGLGDPFIDLQDEINVLSNLFNEYLVYGIPPILHAAKAINKEAIKNMTAEVAQWIPTTVVPEQGQPLSNSFWQPLPAEVPAPLIERLQTLTGQWAQFLLGIYPALTGGELNGATNETKGGLQIQLQQSMGRIALFYRRVRSLYQKTMLKAVREFAANRETDVSLSMRDPAAKPRRISPIAIRKGNFNVYPEADEGYPALYSDKRTVLMNFMGFAQKDPEMAKWLDLPANQRYVKSVFGMSEIIAPGEDSSLKQMKEIEMMLAPSTMDEQGQPASAGPMPDPATGQEESTVPIQPLDRDDLEFETCVDWASSDAGMEAAEQNPAGYADVMAHAAAHQTRMSQRQAAAATAQATNIALSKGKPEPPKPPPTPAESIAFKDLPPDGQAQMAAQAGITLSPEDTALGHAVDVAKAVASKPPQMPAANTKSQEEK